MNLDRNGCTVAGRVAAAAPMKFSEGYILQTARSRGPRESIVVIGARTAVREILLRTLRSVNFRQLQNAAACAAYEAMQVQDFLDINARQAWANWRTIPRNLNGNICDRPMQVIDLCSGTGASTEVLAYYCPPGSRILGYEFNQRFVDFARQREYRDRDGNLAQVHFVKHDVLKPFPRLDGSAWPDQSIDLINASGAIGCHFDLPAIHDVAAECSRVLRDDGLALMDAGRGGVTGEELAGAFAAYGLSVISQARSCFVDQGVQLSLKRTGHPVTNGAARFSS